MFFKTRLTCCSTPIHAIVLIPFMEYGAVFLSIFVNPFTLVFKEDVSSFATHCFTFCLDSSFRSRTCSSDSSLLFACLRKNCSSSATSKKDVVTPIDVFRISSRILRRIFSVTLISNLQKKSGAVLTQPAMCANLNLNCST